MESSQILIALASGGLGSLIVLLLQEVRSSYEKQKENLIGTIALSYKIHNSVAALATLHDTIITKISAELKKADTGKRLKLSSFESVEKFLLDPLPLERSITLQYSSLGCFFVIQQINKYKEYLAYLNKSLSENISFYDTNFNVNNAVEFNKGIHQKMSEYLLSLERNMHFQVRDYESLLTMGLKSVRGIRLLNLKHRKDIKRLIDVINETKKMLESIKNYHTTDSQKTVKSS